jgi:glycosyltransferase involved in cell wall biosynthesis
MTRLGARRVVTAPWLHEFRGKRRERFACAKSTCVLATNSAILRDLDHSGISNPRTFITGNPVPQERVEFGRSFSKSEARRRIGLDTERPVIGYTGKLYLGMKELDYFLEAAQRLTECLFLLNGGQPPVIEVLTQRLRERGISNVRLVGILKKPEESRFYQKAADVLVTYHSIVDHPYADHNLPNKLAEYMTTGNPIVAADSPAIEDILNPGNAILVKRDDVDALVAALKLAIRDRDRAMALAAHAQRCIAARTTEAIGAELGSFLSAAVREVS